MLTDRGLKQRAGGMAVRAPENTLVFDSFFEGGNLDLVVQSKEGEYDLYMRPDSNTRGHHQWFYFTVANRSPVTAKFTILNFTKRGSLFGQGMRVATFSEKKAEKASRGELPSFYKNWHRAGENIAYRVSRLTQELAQKARIMYELILKL